MNSSLSHDVIISGGGMVGLALACAASQSGLRVALIERNEAEVFTDTPGQFSPRVSAINLASERLLRNIGAWQHLPTHRLSPYSSMSVWDGLGQGNIDFDSHTVNHNQLGYIIENNQISYALWQIVKNESLINVFTRDEIKNIEQHPDHVVVTTRNHQHLTASVLVGSEGKNSPVREVANIEMWQWAYQHTAIVTTVEHEISHNQCARQVFLDNGPLAFLPLNDTTEGSVNTMLKSSIVWSVKSDQAQAILDLDDKHFNQKLTQVFEQKLGAIAHSDPRHAFQLSAQQAKTYFNNRIVILGDAAHTIHPLAGLGVNLGFLDAAALAQQWKKAKTDHMDLAHDHVMRRYQRQRQAHNLAVAALMEGLKRLFDSQAPAPVLVRNKGLSFLNNSNLVKRPLILGALGEFGTPLPELCR